MDHYKRSSLNHYASYSIDRTADKRRDEAWISVRLKDPTSLFVPVWQMKNIFTHEHEKEAPQPVVLPLHDMAELMESAHSIVFLGEENNRAIFAVDLLSDDPSLPESLAGLGNFRDLRQVGGLLSRRDAALLAYARALLYWHRRNRFCGDCGSPASSAEGGHSRVCTNEQCKQQRFPRTDPAIIVLVASGDCCLLARQSVWPKGMYSTLAGFVEPGESLEDAVAREVLEESGIRIDEIHYHSSQPWPFPCSIMVGFTAHAATREIRLGDNELEDALWFSRAKLRHALASGTIRLPSHHAIAYRLIEDWFDSVGSIRLGDIVNT